MHVALHWPPAQIGVAPEHCALVVQEVPPPGSQAVPFTQVEPVGHWLVAHEAKTGSFVDPATGDLPATLRQKLAEMNQALHEDLARVYERIRADGTDVGKRFPGTVRDLSVNGCFVEGYPLPLLSRVGFAIWFGRPR